MTTEPAPQLSPDSSPAAAPVFGTVAAASVMAECLSVQSQVHPRSALARCFGRSPLSEDSRSWYLGTLGERDAATRLESLDEGWAVLHSVPIGTRGSDIDHVVVGAAGVFTINTKLHEGARIWVGSRRLLVNGQKTDHLRNTRYEIERTRKLLSTAAGIDVPVRGAIVIVGAKEITIREQPEDVAVLAAPQLLRWLKKQKPLLNPAKLTAVTAVVRDEATWSSQPQPLVDAQRFSELRREVESARRIRMLWGGVLLVAILSVGVPFAVDLYTRVFGS